MKRAALRSVPAGWIRIKNMGDLRQHSIVACSMPHHVAREKANMAAIKAVCHPICGGCRLLPLLNLNLHLPKAHHHLVLGHHLTADAGVLLTKASPVTHLCPKDLHQNTSWMKRTMHLHNRRRCGNHFRGRGNICRCRGKLLQCLCLPRHRHLRHICHQYGCAIDCPSLFCHHHGQSSNCHGSVKNCPGECSMRSNICSKHAKDCLALWVGSSAHKAVLAPLVEGGRRCMHHIPSRKQRGRRP